MTRSLELVPMSRVTARRVEWLWTGRIPAGELTLLAGPEGTGKSTLLAHLAAEVTRGRLDGDRHGMPLSVCVAALEDDDASTLRPRLEAAGANLDLVATIRVSLDDRTPGALQLPTDTDALAARISSGSMPRPVGLVIVDPIKSAGIGSLREDTEVRALLAPLVDLAQRRGIAVVASGHFKKGAKDEDFAAWKVSGSPAWTQVPRSVLFFDQDPEEEDDENARIIAHAKCNLARKQPTVKAMVLTEQVPAPWGSIETSRLVLGGESDVSARDMRSANEASAKTEAVAFLRQYLSDGKDHERRQIVEAARAEGISDSTLDRARRALRIQPKRYGSGEGAGSTWGLPAGELADMSEVSEKSQQTRGLTHVTHVKDAPKITSNTAALDRSCRCADPLPYPAGDALRCSRCEGLAEGWGVAA